MSFKQIITLKNLGFCYGVNQAINLCISTVQNPEIKKPIYLLGNIVHNDHIHILLDYLNIKIVDGVNRLKMIEQVPDNSTLIFSAHGVSDKVRKRAIEKNLTIVDAACPYVNKTFKLLEETVKNGYDVLFIGKANHPETEAVLELSPHCHLVDPNNIYIKGLNEDKLVLAHQTTMSSYDIEVLYNNIKSIYPNIKLLDMICKVTEKRQQELNSIKDLDLKGESLIIIIGDKNSNNSTKLYELAQRIKSFDSIFIESIGELNLNTIRHYDNIIVSSGTSTPTLIINEVLNVLNNIDNYQVDYIKSNISPKDFL